MSEIIATFPRSEFTPLNCSVKGKPDHTSIALLEKEVFENARAIYSPLGTGTHGHLFLVVSDARYITLTGAATAPVPPTNPGVHPVLGGTAHEIAQAERVHKNELAQFKTCTIVDAHIKKLILAAVPATYIEELSDTVMGFANVTTLQILDHLRTTYGIISPDDLKTNLKNLSRQWSPDQPLTNLWAQIKTCQDFAASSVEPIPDATIVRITVDNLEDSKVFPYDIRDWRKRPIADHTIAHLKSHFNLADIERIRMLSSKSAGFTNQTAHVVAAQPKASQPLPSDFINSCYCWSHGLNLIVNGDTPHNSKTCKTRAPNHREDATLVNRMGGCNLIRSARNDRMIWKKPEAPPKPNNPE
jgi:hypothetical protein